MVSRVITTTMLFLQFILYSSSFVSTLKNEIPGAALDLYQLKLKQFSPDILKFSTKHEDNPFTLNCFMVPRTCLFAFDAGSRRLGSNNFRNSSYKKNGRFGPCFQTIFPFFMTMDYSKTIWIVYWYFCYLKWPKIFYWFWTGIKDALLVYLKHLISLGILVDGTNSQEDNKFLKSLKNTCEEFSFS